MCHRVPHSARHVVSFILLLLSLTVATIHSLVSRSDRPEASTTRQLTNVGPHKLWRGSLYAESTATPPLIVCVGTAQTAALWENLLIPPFALTSQVPLTTSLQRDVLIYQATGLGSDYEVTGDLDVTLQTQATTLMSLIQTEFSDVSTTAFVDMAGFSLGGRIAMAFACEYPHRVRKLHLTGVGLQRSDFGHVQIAAWKDHLSPTSAVHGLRAFAWSAILASYSPAFVKKQLDESRLEGWIAGVCQQHTPTGLLALLEHAHDDDGPWSVSGMAQRLSSADKRNSFQGQLLVGEFDVMSPVDQVQSLATALQWDIPTIVPSVGHCVPIENTRAWKDHLFQFLDK